MTTPRRTLDLAKVKSLIKRGLTTRQIRIVLACRYVTLIDFMRVHSLRAEINAELAAEAAAQATESNRIPFYSGGDEAFSKGMNGRLFDEIRFKPSAFGPIHKPHKIPGDDHSTTNVEDLRMPPWRAKREMIERQSERTIADVRYACACYFGVTEGDLKSARQGARLVAARRVALAAVCRLTSLPKTRIGAAFGDLDRHTVNNALAAVRGSEPLAMALDAILFDLANPIHTRRAA